MESERSSRTEISSGLFLTPLRRPPRPAAGKESCVSGFFCMCAGPGDIRFFSGIRNMAHTRNGAAGRKPAERFRTGLKESAAGQRPVFPGRRETETELQIPFLSKPETGNHKDFLSTVSGTAGAGIKRPLHRQRTEIVTARNFCRYLDQGQWNDSKKYFVSYPRAPP